MPVASIEPVCAIMQKEIVRRAEEAQKAELEGRSAPQYNHAVARTHGSTKMEAGEYSASLSRCRNAHYERAFPINLNQRGWSP